MRATRSQFLLLVGVALMCLIVGAVGGWKAKSSHTDDELRQFALVSDMHMATIGTTILKTIEDGRVDVARQALVEQVERSVWQAHLNLDVVGGLDAIPNIREGAARAADYLASVNSRRAKAALEVHMAMQKLSQ